MRPVGELLVVIPTIARHPSWHIERQECGAKRNLRSVRERRVPLQYRRDDANELIRVTATDPVTLADMISFLHELVAIGAWQYGRIFDTRASSTPMAEEEATVIGYIQTLAAEHGRPGPLAIVARDPSMIGRCEVHAWRMANVRSGSVFWDPDEAADWLIQARRAATD